MFELPEELVGEMRLGYQESISIPVTMQPTQLGLQRDHLRFNTNDPTQPIVSQALTGTGIPIGGVGVSDFDWGDDYVHVISGASSQNTVSDGGGYFELAVPPLQEYSIAVFDPASGYIATQAGALGISGGFSDITSVLRFRASEAADQDGDGLPDDIEKAIGSNLASVDSDEDGIDDFTEIQQGLNPLDGAVLPLGLVSSIRLPGPARELHIDASPAGQQLAYVATGGHGLAIVDVTSWQNPILLGQLDLPGNASDLELLPERSQLVISAGSAGLHIVDIADPMQPSLIKTIDQPSTRVEVVDNVAYVASGESLVTVDLETDEVSGGRSLGGGDATDIAVMGRHIFTMTATGSLQAHEVDGIAIQSFTPLALDHAGGKIFAGDNVIYAAAAGTFFRGGMSTVDASSPQVLQLISGSDVQAPFVGPGTDILVNGSGIGLLVGAPEFAPLPELRVLDTNDLTQTNLRIGGFTLPDVPHAVGLAGGVAFVADQRGLKVVNYMQRDNNGQAPEVAISTTVTDAEPEQDGLQVLEGTTFPIQVDVTDDVQVREVQLLVNGQVVQRDLQFPWDFATIVPSLDVTGEMELVVRAIDTGGNSSTSNRIRASIVQDLIPPTVEGTVPTTGDSLFAGLRRIAVRFSEPLSDTTIDSARFHLRDASDGQILPQAVHLRDDNQLAVLVFAPLPPGEFDLVVDAATITDRVGNPLGNEVLTLATLQLIPPEVTSFYPFRTFAGPGGGATLATADLNGDGFLDVVAGGSSLAGFTVSLGDEEGNLSLPVEFPLTVRPSKILLADLNGDGADDVVALSSRGMVTALGNHDGTFQAEQTVTVPGFLYDVVAGDFNNDGKVDLIVSDANSDRDFSPAVILLGVGDGTFDAPSDITTSIAAQPRDESVTSGDFNGDGNLDLVLTHRSPGWGMIVLQGNGDGSFTEVARHATENTPVSPVTVDLDSDGDLDIAIATMFGNNIELFFNDGGGVFDSRSKVASGRRTKLRVADMNNDSHPDLLAISGFTLTQWLGVGDGSFGAAVNTSALGQHFETMDLDDDGNMDVLYTGHNLLGRVLGKGDGSFPVINASGIAETSGFSNDVDLDGDIDIATVSGRTIKIYENDGDAGFTHIVSRAPRSSSVSVSAVGFGDLNSDGHPDLITATSNNRTTFGGVEFWLTDATGAYSGVGLFGSISSWPRAMEVADVNADGVADVVVAVGRELSGGVFREVNVLLGTGVGSLAAPIKMSMPFAPYSIATGDFNEDGHIDIVTGNNANSISLFLGNGDGTFQPRTDFATSERARQAILVKDLDGDENLDVVVAHSVGTSVLLGRGDGTFESPFRIGTTLTHRVFAEDVTQDGVQDLILQNGSGPAIYPGVGDGTFDDPLTYGFVTPWMVADFDGDQDPDIINGGQLLFHQGGNQAFALRLAPDVGRDGPNNTLHSEQLTTIVDAAIDRFVQVGLPEEEAEVLRSISFQIADLSGDHLGFSFVDETVVWLDINAAGAGWFVDETPEEDSEFTDAYESAVHGRADLLTVVLHEMGHILGERDSYKRLAEERESELMDAFLELGTRLLPTEELIQDILLGRRFR
ncbi:MAG: FG-GAP-like repeat-containing protein [Planctomycetota bacterium]